MVSYAQNIPYRKLDGADMLTKVSDIQHECWLRMLNGVLYWAPIGRPKNVLDIVSWTTIFQVTGPYSFQVLPLSGASEQTRLKTIFSVWTLLGA